MIPFVIYTDRGTLEKISGKLKIKGIALWPVIIITEPLKKLINHEKIHIKQQQELLVIPFYLLYGLFWLIGMIKYKGDAAATYFNNPFEKEAFANEEDYEYINKRRLYSWINYIK